MPSPLELAKRRAAAIEALQATLSGHVDEAERRLYTGLLERLSDIQADPTLISQLLAEYQQQVALPLAVYYAQAVLTLPALTETYFADLGVTGYNKLRAPLTDYLTARLGITATGDVVPGGYLSTLVGDTSAQQALLRFAYSAQASGVGLSDYREGLKQVALGVGSGKGLMQALYSQAFDDLNSCDRQLQRLSAERLGLKAFLYQGGLIVSSRSFCKVRNGKVFLDWEVERFGTKEDTYSGYTNKAEGLFAGKSEPYEPFTSLGGYQCRHGLHALSNSAAMALRPELAENEKGQLYIK